MEKDQDHNSVNLLEDLTRLLQNPELPALLGRLHRLDSNLAPEDRVTQRPVKKPSLLERLDGLESSKTLKRSLSPTGEESRPKRRQLLPSSASSGRTLMSRLLNHKETRHLTPISLRSSLHRQLATTLDNLNHLGLVPVINRNLQDLLPPIQAPGRTETAQIQTRTMTTTSLPKNNASSSQTCPGTLKQGNHLVHIATPVAKKPVGFLGPTTEMYPKLSSSLKSPPILQPESLLRSGSGSSKEKRLISTKSSHRSTMLSLMKRERAA